MKKSVLSSLVVGCIILFCSSLFAGGLGIAFPFGFGTTDYDWYEADASQFGINFVFDTNVAKRSVFNYRLNVGVEFFNHEYNEYYDDGFISWDYTASHEGLRIVTDHTFGFGIVKSSVVRLWMGPCVRFGFLAGDEAGFTVGGGITALGLNFNMGPVFTLGLEAGYLFNADLYFDPIDYTYDYWGDYDQTIDSGLNNMFVIKLVILFRINDTYDDFF